MKKYNFNFVSKFPIAVVVSLALVIGSIALLFTKGLNYGVDFRGGAEIQIGFEKTLELKDLRGALEVE